MFTPNNCQLPGQNWYFYIPSLTIRGIREIRGTWEIGEIWLLVPLYLYTLIPPIPFLKFIIKAIKLE